MSTEPTPESVDDQASHPAIERSLEEIASQIDADYEHYGIKSSLTFIHARDGLQEYFVGADKLFQMFDRPGYHRDSAIELTDSLDELFLDLQRRVSRKAEEYRRIAARANDDGSDSEQLSPF
ncbi:MAG: hypothetical protein O2945_02730 [Planctomycetota bacterium]|nr:hypothetical protein [Planctomycetota bacterium]